MGFMHEFPHSKQFDSDLREILEMYLTVKDLPDKWVAFEKLVSGEVDDLKYFVNNYFNNLNVQNEINNKLDAMASDGSLTNLIRPLFNEFQQTVYVLSARMDTFTSLPEGATSGDAELADAHVDYKGENYINVGEHIRSVSRQLSLEIGDIGKIVGGVSSLKFARGTIYQGQYTENSTNNIAMPHYITLDYDVTISIADGYRYGYQRIYENGDAIDEFGNNTFVSNGTTLGETTFYKNVPFRLFVTKNGSTYNEPCDIAELQFALSMSTNNLKNIVDTRIYTFIEGDVDSGSYNKALADYEHGKITIEKIGFSLNSAFPSNAGILVTFNLWTNEAAFQIFHSYDYKGVWNRQFDSNGKALQWFKNVTDFEIKNYVTDRTSKRYHRIPLVTFVDDDGSVEVYNKYKPIAQQYNVPFCSTVCTNFVGGNDGREVGDYMSWEQIRELQDNFGFEFMVHSWTHQNYTTLSHAEIYSEMEIPKRELLEHGINVRGISYPNGASNETVRQYASQLFDYGFKGEDSSQSVRINTGCVPSFYINRCLLGSYFDRQVGDFSDVDTSSLEYYKSLVDECVEKDGWLVFCLHAWHSDFDETQIGYLKSVIEYCQSLGVKIVTASEAYEMFKNEVEVGDYLGYWNEKGIAVNKDGLIDIPLNDVPNDISTRNCNQFPKNQISTYRIFYDNSEGFPENAGLYEVHRFGDSDFCFAMYYCALSDNIYRRRFDSDGNPLSWVLINSN